MKWGDGVPSDWEGRLGQLNGAEAQFSIQRLNRVVTPELGLTSLLLLDTSGMGAGNDGDGGIPDSICNLDLNTDENCSIEMLTMTTAASCLS